MKLIEGKKNTYSLVTQVENITVGPIIACRSEAYERKIEIKTAYGEVLELILYADTRAQLETWLVPWVYTGKSMHELELEKEKA